MQYAVLGTDKETLRKKLEENGKTIDYEDFSNGVYVGRTEATLLEMKQIYAEMRDNADAANCKARIYKKERRFKNQIRDFLSEDDMLKIVIME